MDVWSAPVSMLCFSPFSGISLVITIIGTHELKASTIPGNMCGAPTLGPSHIPGLPLTFAYPDDRSEERRVGKECRSRWSPYH